MTRQHLGPRYLTKYHALQTAAARRVVEQQANPDRVTVETDRYRIVGHLHTGRINETRFHPTPELRSLSTSMGWRSNEALEVTVVGTRLDGKTLIDYYELMPSGTIAFELHRQGGDAIGDTRPLNDLGAQFSQVPGVLF